MIADCSGTAVFRLSLGVRNGPNPYVFSHKVAPGDDVGNLVCATGAGPASLRSNVRSMVKLNSGVQIAL